MVDESTKKHGQQKRQNKEPDIDKELLLVCFQELYISFEHFELLRPSARPTRLETSKSCTNSQFTIRHRLLYMVWPNKLWEGVASNIVDKMERDYGRSSRGDLYRHQRSSRRPDNHDRSGSPAYNDRATPPALTGGGSHNGSDGRMHYPARPGGGPSQMPAGYRRGEGGGFGSMGGPGESFGQNPSKQPLPYTSADPALSPMGVPMSRPRSRGGASSLGYGGYGRSPPSPPSFGHSDGDYRGGQPPIPSFSGPPGRPQATRGSFSSSYPFGQGPNLERGGGRPRGPTYSGGDGDSSYGSPSYGGSQHGNSRYIDEPIIQEIRPRGYTGDEGSYRPDQSHSTRGLPRRDYGGYDDYR